MKRGTWKRLLAAILTLTMMITMLPFPALAAGSSDFKDVGDDDWFRDAVDYVVGHDIFSGTSDTRFEPNGGMTRAMMVTVLGRVAQIDPDGYTGGSGFTDVERGSWYEPYVVWAEESDITNGVAEGFFAPNDQVTRAQMAVFLMRLLQYLGADAPAAVTDELPVDYDAIPDYARGAAELMWKRGVFQGGGDGCFDPKRQLTRAEAAALLMRIDQHLVDMGVKEYPDGPQEGNKPVWTPGGSSGGGQPGGGETGSVFYTPTVNDTPNTAAKVDVESGFSIIVKRSGSMTAEEVKAAITAVDTSDPVNTDHLISVSDNQDGTFTITGLKPHYDYDHENNKGLTEYVSGFVPGHAYKITLNAESLTFDGEAESVREYNFTVKREETLNVKLRDDIVYIPANQVDDDGMLNEAGLLEVDQDGIKNAGKDVKGTFTLAPANSGLLRASQGENEDPQEGNGNPQVGDIVAVYEGTHPDLRTATSTEEANTAPISYVRITKVEGSEYSYEGVETKDVLDMPEIFPVSVSADTDGDTEDKKATLPASAFVYSGSFFAEAGLDADAVVEEGDYIAFYNGYLNTAADTEADLTDSGATLAYYARIDELTESEGNYEIAFTEVSLDQIITEQSSYTSQEMNMGQVFTEDEITQMEEDIEIQVQNSGMAEEVVQAVANAALAGESLEILREELGLTTLSVNQVGSGLSANFAAGGSGGSSPQVKVTGADAKITRTSERYGGPGLTVKLNIQFTVTMNQNLKMDFEITLEQQLKIVLQTNVDTVCEWLWGFIPHPDWIVTATFDIYSYTGIDIDMHATTDDGVTEVTDYVDMIKSVINRGGDESTAETLTERYQNMLEQDSDWVDLFTYRLMREKKSLAKVVNFSMELSFVVSANVNVYVGVDFDYEIGRRYIFTMQILHTHTSNDTVSLIPEQYELEVYVMGVLGLRAGLRLDLAASLIHKKVAGVGVTAEAGAYIELYGYFYYLLEYLEGEGRKSQAAGNLYVEVGIYVDIGAQVEAIGGLVTWAPTIYGRTFPLWTAGNRYSVLGFHEPEGGIGTLEFCYTDVYSVPASVFTMDVMDMKTGKVTQSNYANMVYGINFDIENTNSEIKGTLLDKLIIGPLEFPLPSWQYQLQAARPIEDMNRSESGQLIITYSDPTVKLAFRTEPMRRVVNYNWDQVGDKGFNFVLSSETNQAAFYNFQGTALDYDLNDFYRYGYERLGWFDMNGTYEDLEIGSAENLADIEGIEAHLVQDDNLPRHIEGEDHYYIEVSRKIPVPYTVRHHYQALDGSYPESGEGVETTKHTDGRSEEIITPGKEGEPFGTAAKQKEGFGMPFTRGITIIKDENAVADLYYPRESYTATINYTVDGSTVKDVTYKLKYGQAIPMPAMDGYTLDDWTTQTMPAQDTTYTASFTANENTPYVVEPLFAAGGRQLCPGGKRPRGNERQEWYCAGG